MSEERFDPRVEAHIYADMAGEFERKEHHAAAQRCAMVAGALAQDHGALPGDAIVAPEELAAVRAYERSEKAGQEF